MKLLPVSAAARLLNVSVQAVRARIARGTLPGVLSEGEWFVDAADLPVSKIDRWIFGEGQGGEPRSYLIHTQYPRFIAEVFDVADDEGPGVVVFSDGQAIDVAVWIDAAPTDVAEVARLMREAGEALAEYDAELGL